MKYLHSWLQEYIEEKIPQGEELREAISINAFEVEEVSEIENKLSGGKDFVYEINVLPNRNHDALSHYFMSQEIALMYDLKFKKIDFDNEDYKKDFLIKKTDKDFIKIEDYKSCSRFMGCKIENVSVKPSPDFIKYRLESIGQKSINNIVDITNYVQFAFNKPMHVYDENLVSNFLEARFAKEGETMTTLDNKELKLDDKTLIISDSQKVLGLAGIKGGNSTGISENTKNIIVESANFNAQLIRKTSQKYDIRTDASKRFENEISDKLVEIGMIETLKLIKEFASDENTKIEIKEIVDNCAREARSYHVGVSKNEVNNLLGINLNNEEISKIFKRFGFKFEIVNPKVNMEILVNRVEGKAYHLGASVQYDAPELFDCSSLTSWLYKESGISIPRISVDQFLFSKRIEDKDLRFGDLIFVNNDVDKVWYHSQEYMKGTEIPHGINHVGMYLGDGKVIHATKMFGKVVIENLGTAERFKDIVGYGRVVENLEEERFVVSILGERLDLRIKEDLIEEIARVYGLNNIKSVLPELNKIGKPNKTLYYENKIKNILFKNGFSEVYTYSLKNKGDIEILKSVAQDKNFLRINLSDGLQEAVQKNIFNMPLLNTSIIKIFEFGNCFKNHETEWMSLAIAIDDGKKNKEYKSQIQNILEEIKKEIGVSEIKFTETKNAGQKENCIEINFEELIANLPEGEGYNEIDERIINQNMKYKAFALTPFIVRDIACWTPENTNENDVENIIRENITSLCISVKLFDKFEKEIEGIKKKSFGFRLIYQDESRTLTDEEVNLESDKVYEALKTKGFEIR
ncbi:MAG: phenylalanine--tRNA ligase beta subunit-related protein [Candidatus Nomurabacteria bacterium]